METNKFLGALVYAFVVTAGTLGTGSPAASQDLSAQKEALDMIAAFAERVCPPVSAKGQAETLELTGDAKAELSRVVSKLAELGIEGALKYQSTEYEGVLQKDLARTIRDSNDCRKEVAKGLTDKLVMAADASGSYYSVQLNGQPATVGKAFTVDLGSIAAGSSVDLVLAVRLVSGGGQFGVGEPAKPLSVVAPTGREVELASQQPVTFTLRLENPTVEGPQVREMRLVSPLASNPSRGQAPLLLTIKWNALAATVTVTAHSGPKPSGNGRDFSRPYEVCASAPSPDYVLARGGAVSLTGDRACNAWSTCTERREEKRLCLLFTLQGHDECQRLLSRCDASRSSEGHVTATFRLRPAVATLVGS